MAVIWACFMLKSCVLMCCIVNKSHSRFLKRYLQKETELLKSSKANVSAATRTNRQKKMQEISSLIKFFVRCANKRKLSAVFAHSENVVWFYVVYDVIMSCEQHVFQ